MQFRPARSHLSAALVALGAGAQVLAGEKDGIAWLLCWCLVAVVCTGAETQLATHGDQKSLSSA